MSDYKGTYCGNIKSTEYGLYSIYGWCEDYEKDAAFFGNNSTNISGIRAR